MAEINNYTLSSGSGLALCALGLAAAKSAFAQVQSSRLTARRVLYG
jgi:hypothetical protein